jgi:c(7)-type cytochrome triheme protein
MIRLQRRKAKILFFALGAAACVSAQAAQEPQHAPVPPAVSAAIMPTSDDSSFSHDFHVNKVGFNCADCHDSLFQQVRGAAKAAGDFTMSAFDQGKYCGACHDGSTAFAVTERDSCARCHDSDMKAPKTIVFEQPVKTVVFDHGKHAEELGIACGKCHESLFKMKRGETEKQSDFTMEAMRQGKYCGACHDRKTRCDLCHIGAQGGSSLLGKEQQPGGQ